LKVSSGHLPPAHPKRWSTVSGLEGRSVAASQAIVGTGRVERIQPQYRRASRRGKGCVRWLASSNRRRQWSSGSAAGGPEFCSLNPFDGSYVLGASGPARHPAAIASASTQRRRPADDGRRPPFILGQRPGLPACPIGGPDRGVRSDQPAHDAGADPTMVAPPSRWRRPPRPSRGVSLRASCGSRWCGHWSLGPLPAVLGSWA
jgi:hypothetical protein